jgi:hypothetical protein
MIGVEAGVWRTTPDISKRPQRSPPMALGPFLLPSAWANPNLFQGEPKRGRGAAVMAREIGNAVP